jgi:hypothetical protein
MAAKPKVSEERIIAALKRGLTWSEMGKHLGLSMSGGVYDRIQRIARKHDIQVAKAYPTRASTAEDIKAADAWDAKLRAHARKHISVGNGIVLVGSDCHYWPGRLATAHLAFCKLSKELRPSAVVINGDGFDGASISRHPRIGWDRKPKVQEELSACVERFGELEEAAGTKALYWPLGNHDARFETFLAAHAPEFEGVDGFQLKDKFPLWTPCWSVWVNNEIVIKHRLKGGIHATHNNTVTAGKTVITGHLHSQKVTPYTDYNGTRWGVDCGMMAEVGGPQFVDYLEDNPVNWRAGFIVLTFWNGKLLTPEMVRVLDEEARLVEFRGQVIEV